MAEGTDKLHIRLNLHDTEIPMTINRDDEVYYRAAATDINEAVNAYSEVFKGRKSDKEILYMAMIEIAVKYEFHKSKNDTAPITDVLSKLTQEIEEALKK